MIDRVELNITFACNLACRSCNRLCNLTRLDGDMTVDQVQMFVNNLAREGRKLRRVKVVGGEPTIHPQFREICEVLLAAKGAGWIEKVAVNTNGVTAKQFAEKPIPVGIRWMVSPPTRKTHRPFLWSPLDLGLVGRGPCKMPRVCGFSLDATGWLPCSAAIAVARLFSLEHLYKSLEGSLPEEVWGMEELCRDCLFGVSEKEVRGRHFSDMPAMWGLPSPRWAGALWKYRMQMK